MALTATVHPVTALSPTVPRRHLKEHLVLPGSDRPLSTPLAPVPARGPALRNRAGHVPPRYNQLVTSQPNVPLQHSFRQRHARRCLTPPSQGFPPSREPSQAPMQWCRRDSLCALRPMLLQVNVLTVGPGTLLRQRTPEFLIRPHSTTMILGNPCHVSLRTPVRTKGSPDRASPTARKERVAKGTKEASMASIEICREREHASAWTFMVLSFLPKVGCVADRAIVVLNHDCLHNDDVHEH